MTRPEEQIPQQEEGAQSNTEAVQSFENVDDAKHFFAVVKSRLLQVNRWHEWAGTGSAGFKLTDASGNETERNPQQGDHFKIDIPGPGTITGEGFDWVQIEAIEETNNADEDCLLVQVRPATNPQNERSDVAHFFADTATSNFVVKRSGNIVSAAVHGRNEKPNTATETLIDKARNAAVATGAVTAFSKLQWKALVNGLVKKS